jgi:hypothetical protein
MNGNRKIVVVSTVGIVALVLTTGWSVLAGDAWPPEPWQVNTMEGVWSVVDNAAPGEFTIVVLGAEDPRTGTSSALLDTIGHDWTGNGLFADIESHTPWYGTRVRTGKDIVQGTSVIYFMKDTKPRPTVTWFAVYNETCTLTDPDTAEASGMLSIYSAVEHPGHKLGNLPNQDKNKDGLPDAGEKPILCIPRHGIAHRIGLLPPCELAPKP